MDDHQLNNATHNISKHYYLDVCTDKVRCKAFRDCIYNKALKLGENVMPCDVAELINSVDAGGRYKYTSRLIHTSKWYFFLLVLVDVYQSLGMIFPSKILTRDIYFKYF